jgi:hypothetical protein
MNRLIIICFFVVGWLSVSALFAQGDARYLYVQSEPVRHFELVHAGVVKEASTMGYLILPGLPAASVEFILRLEADRTYRIDLSQGDKGLGLRKKMDEWFLVDLKSGQEIIPMVATVVEAYADSSTASPFAQLLSKAVQDPGLLSNRRTNKVELDRVQVDHSKGKDTVAIASVKTSSPSVAINIDPPRLDTVSSRVISATPLEAVRLLSAVDNKGTWEAIYLVTEGQRVDTVRLELSDLVRAPDTVIGKPINALRGGCVLELEEPAFLQLRARMAAAQDEDEMVLMVQRVVRTECLSVSQIRRLSNVFLYDETRYRFYDAVHGHVTDPANFPELAAYLSDPVYQQRFRALLER